MSQKYIKSQNKNSHNAKSYGKYYATAVYDNHFIGTEELADFIQQQASVKKSDIKAVLDELGAAMRSLLEDLHTRYPRAVIVGHRDLNPGKDCPGFENVAKEYADLQPK
jgi:N-acetyl-anhydromuramyl-L-alanine amidase AmpD